MGVDHIGAAAQRRARMGKAPIMAAVDRLLHHAHLIVTEGPSLRLAEATAGKGVTPLT